MTASCIVRMFQGINFDGTYAPAKQKKNNLTGIIENVPEKVKLKANITRNYIEHVNAKADLN